jgi:AraC-like DNA-binding protein
MDLVATITLLGIVQGFFLGSLLLLSKGPNRRANRFLGALFICYSLSILHFFLDRSGLYLQVPHLMRIGLPVLFLFGPLFFYYVKLLTDRTARLGPRDLVHVIPFLIFVGMMLPFYLSGTEEKIRAIEHLKEFATQPAFLLIATIQVLHLFAYMVPVRRILKRYDQRIHNTRSSLERINLRWLWTGTTLYLVVFGFIQLLTTLQAFGIQTVELYHTSIPIIVTAIIYGLGYLGLRQPEIFSPAEELAAGKKYEKSTLTPELTREYSRKVREYVEAEKAYLDSELTLPALADRVGIPAYQLSQVINEALGSNFFVFINGYRVQEAKRLLLDPAKSAYTILAVAEEAGFNSKSAFNAAFKRFAGQTPSDFRQAIKKDAILTPAA